MQDVSVDMSFDLKELYGQNQYPVALGRGKGKIDCKAHVASVNGAMLNSIFFGQTLTPESGLQNYHDLTGENVPASTPYTITITPPSRSPLHSVVSGASGDSTLPMSPTSTFSML